MRPDSEMIQKTIQMIREDLPTMDQVPPVFFVGNATDICVVVADSFNGDAEKDQVAQQVGLLAKKMKADFILFVSESYVLRDPVAAQEYLDNREKYEYSVSKHPKAEEVVMFMLETGTSHTTGLAPVLAGRVMGDVEWTSMPGTSGRFANLLGKKPTIH